MEKKLIFGEFPNAKLRLVETEGGKEKIEVLDLKSKNPDIIHDCLLEKTISIENVFTELKEGLLKNDIDPLSGNLTIEKPITFIKSYCPKEWGISKKIAEEIAKGLDAEIVIQTEHHEWAKERDFSYRKKWSKLFYLQWHWKFLKRSQKYRDDCDELWGQKKIELLKSISEYGFKNIEDELFLTDLPLIQGFMYTWGFSGIPIHWAMIFIEYERSFVEWIAALIYLRIEPEYFERDFSIEKVLLRKETHYKRIYRNPYKKNLKKSLLLSRFEKWIEKNKTWFKLSDIRSLAKRAWKDRQRSLKETRKKENENIKNEDFLRSWARKCSLIEVELEKIAHSYLHYTSASIFPAPLFNIEIPTDNDHSRIGIIGWPKFSERYIQCEFKLPPFDEQVFGKLYDEIIGLKLPIFQIKRKSIEDGWSLIVLKMAFNSVPFPNVEPIVVPNAVEAIYNCFTKALAATPDNNIEIEMRIESLKKMLRVLDDRFDKPLSSIKMFVIIYTIAHGIRREKK